MQHGKTLPIESSIILVRGQRVILAADLARIYGVETRALNQAVKRNVQRFPDDFVFRLSPKEAEKIFRSRSRSVILKRGQNIKYLPYAFTEHGAIMAANVINSTRAVQMSVFVVRAFVRLRQLVIDHKELAVRLNELERRVTNQDGHIKALFQTVRELMIPPESKKRKIGFLVKERAARYGRT